MFLALSIPLSSHLPDDVLCWDLVKDGNYCVRSAYRAVFGELDRENVDSLSMFSKLCSKIWQANTLPRVKIFFWRACRGDLLTNRVLSKWVPSMKELCNLCGGG